MTETPGQESTTRALLLQLKQRVLGIGKEGFNPQGKYNFRGIDQVINACGPIERELGLLVYPEVVAEETAQHEYGGNRTLAFRTRVQVRYHWFGPIGDELVIGPVAGEAIDTGDKSTAKAMSVALRVMYLQTLTIPTNEPDPDESTYVLAKPAATVSNPLIMAKLQGRINEADTDAKLQAAYKAVMAEADGDKGNITIEDRDALVGQIREAKAVFDAAAARGYAGDAGMNHWGDVVHTSEEYEESWPVKIAYDCGWEDGLHGRAMQNMHGGPIDESRAYNHGYKLGERIRGVELGDEPAPEDDQPGLFDVADDVIRRAPEAGALALVMVVCAAVITVLSLVVIYK